MKRGPGRPEPRCALDRLRQRRQGSDRAGGARRGRRALRQDQGAPSRRPSRRAPVTRADDRAGQHRGDRGAAGERDPTPTLMYAASANGGYVTYVSPLRQEVTLHGAAQITGTRGLGTDLLCGLEQHAGPAGAGRSRRRRWPRAGASGSTSCPARARRGRSRRSTAASSAGEPAEMTILQVRYTGVQISETCTGPSRPVREPALRRCRRAARCWRSLQWIGPKMELLDLQILEPYTGG